MVLPGGRSRCRWLTLKAGRVGSSRSLQVVPALAVSVPGTSFLASWVPGPASTSMPAVQHLEITLLPS